MMILVDYAPSEKLEIVYPSSRHASVGEVMPNVDDMKIVVLLNDAYLEDERVRSIQELKRLTGFGDLAKLKEAITLTEGEKLLPRSLIEGLNGDFRALNVVRDDCGDKECWKTDLSYLTRSLLKPFDDPVGAFTIFPDNESWLIHTRDDEPWIYCLLPEYLANQLLDDESDITEEIDSSFPYS